MDAVSKPFSSASLYPIYRISISFFIAPSRNNSANCSAQFLFYSLHDTIILDGYKLSYKAFDSLRNSGLNIILSILHFARICSVSPTGIVDLITIVGFSLRVDVEALTKSKTASIAEVSNVFNLLLLHSFVL